MQQAEIDTRILKTEYRNYDLIARYWNGDYKGRIWKNNKVITDYEGDDLDLILENLISIVDAIIDERCQVNEGELYRLAWQGIWPKLSSIQIQILQKLACAKQHKVSIKRLRKLQSGLSLREFLALIKDINCRYATELGRQGRDSEEAFIKASADIESRFQSQYLTLDSKAADSFLAISSAALAHVDL